MRIGFVGGGQMAKALAGGFVDARLIDQGELSAFDPYPAALRQFIEQLPGAVAAESNAALVATCDVLFLAVKPQHVEQACAEMQPGMTAGKLVVSIAAGVTLARLERLLGHRRLIRVMPNTPCLIRRGASAFALGPEATADDADLVARLLGSVGFAARLDEALLDAVTGLSGSGPAYVYTVIEALTDAGVRVGLPRATAAALAAHTVRGSAEMVLSQGEHPAVLRDRVTSPGGTTIAGMAELENRALRAALIAAVEAATLRSRELGRDD
jgi:pyrroline-5-carboxylate reductase